MTTTQYKEIYSVYQALVEETLAGLLKFDSQVGNAMAYSARGGKRVRGVAVLAICHALGIEGHDCRLAAAAIEALHAYSLVHDDLPAMDNDDFRRGMPSCHKQFGEANAILAGDGLLTFAFEILSQINDSEVSRRCTKVLSQAAGANGMILGQEIDLADKVPSTIGELNRLHRYKTGCLFECCARLALSCARNFDEGTENAFVGFMSELGIVFQIVDDILDVTSTEDVLGKPINSDEKNGKVTYVSFYSVDHCKKLAIEKTKDAVKLISHLDNTEFLTALAENLSMRIM